MNIFLVVSSALAAFFISSPVLKAHGDEDRVTEVDRYGGYDVVHYDHHHRNLVVDEYGNVIGERTIHHDHHSIVPESCEPSRHHHHRSFFFGF